MLIKNLDKEHSIKVRDTEILSTDTHKQFREKIARIALDDAKIEANPDQPIRDMSVINCPKDEI